MLNVTVYNAIAMNFLETFGNLKNDGFGTLLGKPVNSLTLKVIEKVAAACKLGHYIGYFVHAKLLYESEHVLATMANLHGIIFTDLVLDAQPLVRLVRHTFDGNTDA